MGTCLFTMKIEMVTLALDPLNGTSVSIKVFRKWRDWGIEEVMMKTGLTSAQSLCEFLLQKARRLHQNSRCVTCISDCCDGIWWKSSQIIPHCHLISKIYRWIVHFCVQYLKIIPITIKIIQNPYSLNILSFRSPISSLGQGFTTIFRYDVAVGLWRATGRPLQRILCASSSDFFAIGSWRLEIQQRFFVVGSKKSEYLEDLAVCQTSDWSWDLKSSKKSLHFLFASLANQKHTFCTLW